MNILLIYGVCPVVIFPFPFSFFSFPPSKKKKKPVPFHDSYGSAHNNPTE